MSVLLPKKDRQKERKGNVKQVFTFPYILAGNATLQEKKNNTEGFTAQVVLELF